MAAALVMLLVHAAMAVVLLWTEGERHDRKRLSPLEVTLVTPRPAEPPKTPPPPPRPRPVVRPVETPKPEVAPPPIAPPEPQEAAVASESPMIPVEAAPVESPPTVIEPPRFDFAYLNNPKPAYPSIAKRLKFEGLVVVSVFVNAKGLPERVKLEKSSGVPVLDEAALEAVRHWTFVPARRGDVLIADWVDVPVNFRLRSTDGKG